MVAVPRALERTKSTDLPPSPSPSPGFVPGDREPGWYEEYHPFGTTSWWASASSTGVSAKRYRYTGKERDDETGLGYHGARFYAAWLGRWERPDPAGMVDGPNRYAYCRGNPVGGRDPTGMATRDEDLQNRYVARTTPVAAPPPNSNEALAARGLKPAPPELLVIAFSGGASGPIGSLSSGHGGGGRAFVMDVVLPIAEQRSTSVQAAIIAPGGFDTPAVERAMSFANENMGPDTRVVLFGYSRGGDPAVQTAERLGEEGIDVDRLFLVDPTEGPLGLLGRDDSISENVAAARVVYQSRDWLLSGEAAAEALTVDSALTDLTKEEFTDLPSLPLMAHGGILDRATVSIRFDLSEAAASWFDSPVQEVDPPEERLPAARDGTTFAP